MPPSELSLAEDVTEALIVELRGQGIGGVVSRLGQETHHVQADNLLMSGDGTQEGPHLRPVEAARLELAGTLEGPNALTLIVR